MSVLTAGYLPVTSYSTSLTPLTNANTSSAELSDGRLVFLCRLASGTISIVVTSDLINFTTIVSNVYSYNFNTFIGLCVDDQNNIYIAGQDTVSTQSIKVFRFSYNSGTNTWGSGVSTGYVGMGVSTTVTAVSLFWCNNGGGTNGHGFVAGIAGTSGGNTYCFSYNADFVANEAAKLGNTFSSGYASAANDDDIYRLGCQNGFGSTTGIYCAISTSNSANILATAWTISTTGTIGLSSNLIVATASNTTQSFNLNLHCIANNKYILKWTDTGAGAVKAVIITSSGSSVPTISSGATAPLGSGSFPVVGGSLSYALYIDKNNSAGELYTVDRSTGDLWKEDFTFNTTSNTVSDVSSTLLGNFSPFISGSGNNGIKTVQNERFGKKIVMVSAKTDVSAGGVYVTDLSYLSSISDSVGILAA